MVSTGWRLGELELCFGYECVVMGGCLLSEGDFYESTPGFACMSFLPSVIVSEAAECSPITRPLFLFLFYFQAPCVHWCQGNQHSVA